MKVKEYYLVLDLTATEARQGSKDGLGYAITGPKAIYETEGTATQAATQIAQSYPTHEICVFSISKVMVCSPSNPMVKKFNPEGELIPVKV